jgi:hypothetical protein
MNSEYCFYCFERADFFPLFSLIAFKR